ncbi:hypothetical protein [Bacillus pumilus]|uniref:hypothetical protein n=1 Tax=Bacillus pumilus TaxID=1408 RepID=UPI002492102E|nr:hypothetical protein [Bacillus pumilus]
MNFESKYLVRWGVPGWVLMLFVTVFFVINFQREFLNVIVSKQFSIVGFTAFAAVVGIILGHLIHQISLCCGFVLHELRKFRNWNNYFQRELNVDKQIIECEKIGPRIKDIYSYRLGQLHARRGLITSLIISALLITGSLCSGYNNTGTWVLYIVNIILLVVMFLNYIYFDKNLRFFMDRVGNFKLRDKE